MTCPSGRSKLLPIYLLNGSASGMQVYDNLVRNNTIIIYFNKINDVKNYEIDS